ncbi:MAG TPA: recombinase family protein [Kofleriaceae bacterium]
MITRSLPRSRREELLAICARQTDGDSGEPVVIYARYSTEEQDPRSIDDQVRNSAGYTAAQQKKVVDIFFDEAVSGSHVGREGLQRLLETTTRSRRPPFAAVVVDDLSRLSRNVGDFWRIIDDLAAVGVRVIDVQTGLSSDQPIARQMFGMKALFNDQMLEMIRYQTHRGLAGRAHDGKRTGGSLYGFAATKENAVDDECSPTCIEWPRIEDEIVVLERLFSEYDTGASSYKAIAERLNEERIPAPRDGRGGNKTGCGWADSSIRNILKNTKYIGLHVWNTHKWTLGRNGKRTRRPRPVSEHIRAEVPETAIIDRALFERVQARIARNGKKGGRPPGAGQHPYLVSGLLKCGVCGGPFSVASQKTKRGVRYANFGCTAHRQRGKSICPNASTISERKITEALIAALRDTLTQSDVADSFVRKFERRLAERASKPIKGRDTARLLRDAEIRIKNVTAALARMPDSEALYTQLATEESTVKQLRAEIAQARPTELPRTAPEREDVRAGIEAFLEQISGAGPLRGREILVRMLTPIVLNPNRTAPGTWTATGAVRLRQVVANFSSGGRI